MSQQSPTDRQADPHADADANPDAALFVRLTTDARPRLRIRIDGRPVDVFQGDTVMTALLTHGARLRHSEFSHAPRAGFCLMGACQDCWVSCADGRRLRACSTPVAAGMDILTSVPETSA